MDSSNYGHVTQRPHITVTIVAENGSEIGYDANHVAIATIDGEYRLTFICSGAMVSFPIDRVRSIVLAKDGASWCGACDGQLSSWPFKQPEYHHIFDRTTHERVCSQPDGDRFCCGVLPCEKHPAPGQ